MANAVINVNEVLEGHVSLDLECLDRIYLNAYVNKLQVEGQVAYFLRDHLGNPVPSPAIFEKIGNRFRAAVKAFAVDNHIPILRLAAPDRSRWDDRKIDHVQPYLDRAARKGRTGVVAIVAGQELAWVWAGKKCEPKPGQSRFAFVKGRRQCTVYYFYVLDADFGPGFIKIVSYFPYPAKVCLLTELREGRPIWLVTVRSRDRIGRAARSDRAGGGPARQGRRNQGPIRALSAA